jgi:uncharacterized membrane-anchored protein
MKSPLKQILFITLVFGQLGALGWMIANRNTLVEEGDKIRLECEPIDPRSLLSGDYVILNYKISRFDSGELDTLVRGEKSFRRGTAVWVALEKGDGEFHEATGISRDPGTLKEGELFIRGKVQNYWNGSRLQIRYGLEQYFVPQKEGKKIEKEIKDTSVEVSVNENGDSAVTRIFISGEEVEFH